MRNDSFIVELLDVVYKYFWNWIVLLIFFYLKLNEIERKVKENFEKIKMVVEIECYSNLLFIFYFLIFSFENIDI